MDLSSSTPFLTPSSTTSLIPSSTTNSLLNLESSSVVPTHLSTSNSFINHNLNIKTLEKHNFIGTSALTTHIQHEQVLFNHSNSPSNNNINFNQNNISHNSLINFSPDSTLVGGRIRFFYSNYNFLPKHFLDDIKYGISLPVLPPSLYSRPTAPNTKPFLDEQIQKGILQPATPAQLPFLRVHTPFVVHSSGKNRIVVDFRKSNKYFLFSRFKLNNIATVVQSVEKDDYFCKLDLSSAYYQLPLNESSQLAVRDHLGNVFVYKGLPLGVSFAPLYYTKFMYAIIAELQRRFHIKVFSYIDDLLLSHNDFNFLQQQTQNILFYLTSELGFIINNNKSIVTPTQEIRFLGFILNSQVGTVQLLPEKLKAMKNVIRRTAFQSRCSRRILSKIQGKIASALSGNSRAWPAMQLIIAEVKKLQNTDWDRMFQMTSALRTCLLTINKRLDAKPVLIPHHLNHKVTAYSDASQHSLGIKINILPTQQLIEHTIHLTQQQQQNHINQKELLAALLTLQTISHNLKENNITHGQIHLFIDNITTRAHLKKQRTTNIEMTNFIQRTMELLREQDMALIVRYVPSAQNEADRLSRSRSCNDYRMNPLYLRQAMELLNVDHLSVDMFASEHNTNVDRYISLTFEPKAIAQDALTTHWHMMGDLPYANPPFSLIPTLLHKFQRESTTPMLLVFPFWPARQWMNTIRALASNVLLFPQRPDLFLPPYPYHRELRTPSWRTAIALLIPSWTQRQQHGQLEQI